MKTEQLTKRSLQLVDSFRYNLLPKQPVTFQFIFENEDAFHLTANHEQFDFRPGIESTPTLTLWLDKHTTIWRLLEGKLDGMAAFMAGQYRADGNIVLSQLLLYLFQSPQTLRAHEIKD
jgi:putative sterol carrier protein